MLDGIPYGQKTPSAPKIDDAHITARRTRVGCRTPAALGRDGRQWTFGALFPEGFAQEPSLSETEVLLEAEKGAAVDIIIRFLHTYRRQLHGADGVPTPSLDIDEKRHHSRDEAALRETTLRNLPLRALAQAPCMESFRFPEERATEELRSKAGETVGAATRSCEALKCALEARAESVRDGLYRLHVGLRNTTPLDTGRFLGRAQRFALLSTHIVLVARGAKFVSLLDPPEALASMAAACKQRGLWPALAGAPGERDIVLASPILCRDHPLPETPDPSPPAIPGHDLFVSLEEVASPELGAEP